MNTNDARQTLSEIKDLMNRSSKFLTLSGASSIVIGIYATLAAIGAYLILGNGQPFSWDRLPLILVHTPHRLHLLMALAAILVVVSILTVVALSWRQARKTGQKLTLDTPARRLLWSFAMPLIVGGILCLSLFYHGNYGLSSSVMLIFYGLSLVAASKHTYSSIRYLGYAEILIGLTDSFFEGYALVFWTIGFSLLHILYGLLFCLTKPER